MKETTKELVFYKRKNRKEGINKHDPAGKRREDEDFMMTNSVFGRILICFEKIPNYVFISIQFMFILSFLMIILATGIFAVVDKKSHYEKLGENINMALKLKKGIHRVELEHLKSLSPAHIASKIEINLINSKEDTIYTQTIKQIEEQMNSLVLGNNTQEFTILNQQMLLVSQSLLQKVPPEVIESKNNMLDHLEFYSAYYNIFISVGYLSEENMIRAIHSYNNLKFKLNMNQVKLEVIHEDKIKKLEQNTTRMLEYQQNGQLFEELVNQHQKSREIIEAYNIEERIDTYDKKEQTLISILSIVFISYSIMFIGIYSLNMCCIKLKSYTKQQKEQSQIHHEE